MFPLYGGKEIEEWERELEREYPVRELREELKKRCYINGVLFDRRRIKGCLWDYDKVSEQIRSSMTKLIKASAGCYRLLTRRAPLRK